MPLCHSILHSGNRGHLALLTWELMVPPASLFNVRKGISNYRGAFANSSTKHRVRLCARSPQQLRLQSCTGNVPALPCSWPGLSMANQVACLQTQSSAVGLMNVISFFLQLWGLTQGHQARLNMLRSLQVDTKESWWKVSGRCLEIFLAPYQALWILKTFCKNYGPASFLFP